MPALPEIEVLRRDLEKDIVGRRFKDVEVRSNRNAMKIVRRHGRRKEFQDLLEGAKIESIDRKGRWILMQLDNENTLVIDLGESGTLLKCSASDEFAPHTHILFGFTIGGQLRVIDPKLTGEVFVAVSSELAELAEMNSTALDPLDQNPLTWQHFSSLLADRADEMKKLLTDEKFVVGLGDIYSDEVLWGAGIRYDRPSNKLTSQDVRRLYRSLMETVQDAVRARGTTSASVEFKDLSGQPGGWGEELKVFERDGEPCRRCRHAVTKTEWDDGFTYFCPQCQT
jgi:formamidopyrimidine-DNA glycosylase